MSHAPLTLSKASSEPGQVKIADANAEFELLSAKTSSLQISAKSTSQILPSEAVAAGSAIKSSTVDSEDEKNVSTHKLEEGNVKNTSGIENRLSSSSSSKSSLSNLANSISNFSSSNVSTEVISPPQKKTPQDYIFGKQLGEGSFSSVYLAKDVKTSKEYAIKVCDKQHIIKERKSELIRREKDVLAILSANRSPTAPFFVHLYATFQDAHRLYFVMTFGHGGELLKYLNQVGCFEPKCCRFYFGEIVQAVAHLHKLGIVHRDLKPENILLSEKAHILITDFGSSKVLTGETNAKTQEPSKNENHTGRTRSSSFVGTAQYVSPEVLQGKYTEVGPPADLWALGCILYQLAAGLPPFQAGNEFLIFQKILKLAYEFPSEFDPDARDLVEQLLKLDLQERIGASDTERYKSIQDHPFFKGMDLHTLCDQTPPQILPYLPSANMSTAPLRSQHHIPDTFEPGFNPRVIAERFLRSDEDEDLPWASQETITAYVSEDFSDGSSNYVASDGSENDGLKNLAVGDSPRNDRERKISESGEVRRKISRNRSICPIDNEDRQIRLNDQLKNNPWHTIVQGNLILKQGVVHKRKGLFSRKRMMLLTEGPHLFYCEPNSMTVRGEIPWSSSLKPEAKDFKIFFVHTPNRTYYLEDSEGYALEWCKAINELRLKTYGGENQS